MQVVERERERERILYYTKIKISFLFFVFFTNLSLVTNTARVSTSNKNTNNCGKLKYILRTKRKTITVNLRNIRNKYKSEFSGVRETERDRDRHTLSE